MQFCLLSLWLLVVKPIPPDVEMVSSLLFEKVKGLHIYVDLEIYTTVASDNELFLAFPKLQFTSRTKARRRSSQRTTAKLS